MSKTITDILISWGPMILLIAVWIYFIRRSGAMKQAANVEAMNKLLEEQVTEVRKLNEKLDRIASALERK